MCGSAIAADMPGEQQAEFKNFLIEIDMSMTDQEIVDKLSYYLDNDAERNKVISHGLEWSKKYTQEKYASMFLSCVKEVLEG